MLVTLADSAKLLPTAAQKLLLMQFTPLTSDSLPMEPKDLMTFWATIKSTLKSLELQISHQSPSLYSIACVGFPRSFWAPLAGNNWTRGAVYLGSLLKLRLSVCLAYLVLNVKKNSSVYNPLRGRVRICLSCSSSKNVCT